VRRRGIGHEAEGGKAVVAIVLVLAALVLGGWVAAYAGANGKVPRGTAIAGISVGGHDQIGAAKVLAEGVADELQQPMTVTVGTTTTQVTPADAGLSVDYVASVARALGPRSWDPRHLWSYYTGGSDLEPVVDVDQAKMDAVLASLDQAAGHPAVEGAIGFKQGQMSITQAQDGAQVPHDAAQEALVAAWSSGRRDVSLPLVLTAPSIDGADVEAAVSSLGNPALSGPLTLTFPGSQVTLAPRDYVGLLSFVPVDGALTLQVDPELLSRLVDPASRAVPGTDASIGFANGAPSVVPAVDGQSFTNDQVAAAFLQAARGADAASRTAAVAGTPAPAAFTTDAANALGVGEVVASYGVAAAGPGLATGAERLTGTLVKPGETFSFAGRVGDIGDPGSADRLATATWNAGFLAGLTDVTRSAPAVYVDGSPEGRDVSVSTGADLQLRNDTDHGVLLAARVDGANVVVDVWSTKEYDVTADTGARYAVTPRTTRTDAEPTCAGVPGQDGFSVDLNRTVTRIADGSVVRQDTVTTTYAPSEAVVCAPVVPPPA
jgi:vancomycin resistance protein YoaR